MSEQKTLAGVIRSEFHEQECAYLDFAGDECMCDRRARSILAHLASERVVEAVEDRLWPPNEVHPTVDEEILMDRVLAAQREVLAGEGDGAAR